MKHRVDSGTLDQIETELPTLTIELCSKEFDIIIEGLRSKAIPANEIVIFLVSESGLKTIELNKRIKILVDTLENIDNMPVISLQLTDRRTILVGYEAPYIPFFQHISSSKCKITNLNIDLAYSKACRGLLQLGFDGNTSIKTLRMKCDSQAWKCLEGLKGPIGSLKLYAPPKATISKKGIKSLISLLKQNQRTLTTLEVKYDIEDSEKDILAVVSKINTLTRFKWVNYHKFSGDAIASVLESNPKLEELILESACETKAKAMLKPITTLCQSKTRILKLNLSNVGVFIPALEDNKTITHLKISDHALFYQKALQSIATMKCVQRKKILRKILIFLFATEN